MRSLLLTLLLFAPGIASSQAESLAISLNQGRSLHVAPGGSSEFDIAITRPVGYPYPGGFWSIYDPQAGLGGPSPLRFHIGQRIEGRCDYIPLLADFAPIPNLVGILGAHSILPGETLHCRGILMAQADALPGTYRVALDSTLFVSVVIVFATPATIPGPGVFELLGLTLLMTLVGTQRLSESPRG